MRFGLLLGVTRFLAAFAFPMSASLCIVGAFAFGGMIAVIAVVALVELTHLIPRVPLTTGDSRRESHGQSCGPNSQCHGEPVTRFALEATVST